MKGLNSAVPKGSSFSVLQIVKKDKKVKWRSKDHIRSGEAYRNSIHICLLPAWCFYNEFSLGNVQPWACYYLTDLRALWGNKNLFTVSYKRLNYIPRKESVMKISVMPRELQSLQSNYKLRKNPPTTYFWCLTYGQQHDLIASLRTATLFFISEITTIHMCAVCLVAFKLPLLDWIRNDLPMRSQGLKKKNGSKLQIPAALSTVEREDPGHTSQFYTRKYL